MGSVKYLFFSSRFSTSELSMIDMKSFVVINIILLGMLQFSEAKNAGCPFADRAKRNAENELSREEEVADSETTTPNGCTCISLCETSVGAGNFRYDWCKTKDKCGEFTYAGFYYWDKCQYLAASKPEFTALTWNDKHSQTWSNIVSNNATGPYPNLPEIFTESMKTVFDNEWDVMPEGRKKYIHSVGAVCPFVVNIQDSPFTGIFQTGEPHGMIRLGSAAPIAEGSVATPGGGVKFFRSGRPSADFVILNQLGPIADENYNFFAVPLSNHIPEDAPLALAPLALKFCQAKSCPTKVGLSDACKYDQDGNEVDNVVFPFKVSFVPTRDIKFREEYSELPEFMKQFTDLPVGTVLYQLRGHQSPDDEEGVLLGDVVTTDNCVTSLYGDTKLFFKHQYINEDKDLMSEWADGYDFECTPYCVIPP